MKFASYMELNLFLDLALVLVLSFFVLDKNPKLFIGVILLNLAQYFIFIPPAQEWMHQPAQPAEDKRVLHKSDTEQSTGDDITGQVQKLKEGLLQTGGDGTRSLRLVSPVTTLKNTMGLFDSISRSLGGGNESIGSKDLAERSGLLHHTLRVGEKPGPDGKNRTELSGSALAAAFGSGDLHAGWLVVRIFWLLATFYLYFQRPRMGAVVFVLNLLPVPFISLLLPYLVYRADQLAWVASLNHSLENPLQMQMPWPDLFACVAVICVFGAPLVFLLLGAISGAGRLKAVKYAKYLNPEKYYLIVNGERFTFVLRGGNVMAEGLEFNPRKIIPDPARPNVWTLRSGTVVEFREFSS